MKSRTVTLLSAVLCTIAACSLSGARVSLSTEQAKRAGAAGMANDTDTGGGDAMTGNGASAATLNVADADTIPVPCTDGGKTTVSGTVYDPSGNVPLYNAVVYIPDGAPPSFVDKVACEKCTDSVQAVAVTLSGPDGSFTLDQDVPNSNNIDLVVQLGKWLREVSVPITPCTDNVLTNKDYTRLPRNKSEGHIPKIALSTGHSDALECLLRKIGVDDSEFTTDAHDGRVNMFVGCIGDSDDPTVPARFGANKFAANLGGEDFPSTNELFDSGNLDNYDVVIFSCEGHKCDTIQTPANVNQLTDFANRGGRVYLDHEHYNWINHATDKIKSAASFDSSSDPVPSPLNATINAIPTFPKGSDFATWLVKVGVSTTSGSMDIYSGQTSVTSIDPNRSQDWIFRTDAPSDHFYFTIGTPVAVLDGAPAPTACGRVVFTDLHVSKSGGGTSDDLSDQDLPFPTGCNNNLLTGQEKALEFMIFDLSSCVQKETDKPTPPVVR
jgi:hypothetical protein